MEHSLLRTHVTSRQACRELTEAVMKYRKPIAVIAVVLGVLNGIACSNYRHPSTQQSSMDVPQPSPKPLAPATQTTATTLDTSDRQGPTKGSRRTRTELPSGLHA
jgi:hypothetical protein